VLSETLKRLERRLLTHERRTTQSDGSDQGPDNG
jgi:hypothetical protein